MCATSAYLRCCHSCPEYETQHHKAPPPGHIPGLQEQSKEKKHLFLIPWIHRYSMFFSFRLKGTLQYGLYGVPMQIEYL